MKSLSHQEDEVIYLMQAANLLVYLSFTILLARKYTHILVLRNRSIEYT